MAQTNKLFESYSKQELFVFLENYLNYKFSLRKILKRDNPFQLYEKLITKNYNNIFKIVNHVTSSLFNKKEITAVILPSNFQNKRINGS